MDLPKVRSEHDFDKEGEHYLYPSFRPLASLWDEGGERQETTPALFPSPEYQ
jgi:hypothetical protein